MSFVLPKGSLPPEGSRPLLPPPLAEVQDTDARDRFGLRINFVLLEDTEQMKARFADTQKFVAEAAAAVTRQVGRKQACRLFLRALATPPKGKQPNVEENALLLAAYDRAIARSVPPRRAARVAAEEMVMRGQKVESLATHIRRLVKDRALLEAENLEARRRYQATLLGKFDRETETDL